MAAKKGSRFFVWIILGLLFFGLVGFGATGLTGTVRTLGTVGDKEISLNDYVRDLNQQIRAFEAQINTPVSFPQAQAIGLDQQVLGQIVTRRVLDNEVARLGLSVGDDRVREQVLAISSFQGLSGTFDRTIYKDVLDRNGQSETEFENGLREEISRTLLQAGLVGGVASSDTYAQALVKFTGARRDVTWATVDDSILVEDLPEPTDADLQVFYEANPDRFMLPEAREVTYAWLTPEMIQDGLEIEENALRELYAERIADYQRPERRLVERLVYATEDQAAAAQASVAAGEADFDALVAARGLDLADVDLGDVDQAQMGAAGDAIFSAESGAVVGPLPTSLGPALFRINAVLAAEETTFEQAMPDLRDELAASRARRVIDDARDGMIDLLAGGATVEDLAARTEMQLGQLDWVEGYDEGIAAYDGFRAAVSSTQPGAYAELVDLDDGGVFALRIDGLREPALQDLADVREDAKAGWIAELRQSATLAAANDLQAQILPLTDFGTLGLAAKTETNLTRRSFVNDTSPAFMLEVFEMEPGEVRVLDAGRGAILVRLDAKNDADMSAPSVIAEVDVIKERIAQGIAQDLFEIFATQLQRATEVKINQSAVNAVHSQFQ